MQSDKTESVDLCSHYQTAGWAQAWAFETLGQWWDLYEAPLDVSARVTNWVTDQYVFVVPLRGMSNSQILLENEK